MTKFCKKCNCETERYASGRCKPCRNAQDAKRREKYPERVKAIKAACYAKHAEKNRAYTEAWRIANADRVKETTAKWREANKDKMRDYRIANKERINANSLKWNAENKERRQANNRKWYESNKETLKATRAAWRRANHGLLRIYTENYRSKKVTNGGVLSKGLAEKLFKLQRGKCACCGKPLDNDYHLDHIIPLALGGTNTDDNIQLLTSKCNLQKNAKHPVDFMRQRGYLL